MLVGRVGLFSLGQGAVLLIGAWTGARLLFATASRILVVLIEAGLVTMLIGIAIGLPALRLRGLYLALITLMLAGAITVILATVNFPNGGGGFTGYNGNSACTSRRSGGRRSPGTDPAYFRFAVVVALVMFALVFVHLRTRPGRAWAAIRQSEPAALAAGINTTFYKLWAFALASFITGVAGARARRAGALPVLHQLHHPGLDRLARGGADGRRVQHVGRGDRGAADAVASRRSCRTWGVAVDWLTIVFGIGVLQVLTTAPAGLADQFPKDMRRLCGLISRLWRRPRRPAATAMRHGCGTKGGAA